MGRKSPSIALYVFLIAILVSLWPASPLTDQRSNPYSEAILDALPPARGMAAFPSEAGLLPAAGRAALSISRKAQAESFSISGRVTDPSGLPLAGITVAAGAYSAVTDPDGAYSFAPLPAGEYALTASYPSYSFSPPAVQVTAGEQPASADFTGVACLPGSLPCAAPPLLDLPIDLSGFNGNPSLLLLGNAAGQGPGLVNTWFDHTSPNYIQDGLLTRWDGSPFDSQGGQGVSWYDGHDGIDFAPAPGVMDNRIYASASGVVTRTVTGCLPGDFPCGGYLGNQVWIDHGGGFATLYGHLSEVFVQDGEILSPKDLRARPLGLMGMTGNSRGVNPIHLHFGLYYDPDKNWMEGHKAIDPYGWWGPDPASDWVSDSGASSLYLWKYPLVQQAALDGSGARLQSATGRITASLPSGAVPGLGAARLLETPPTASLPRPSGMRPVGVSFWLSLLQGGQPSPAEAFLKPVTLRVSYAASPAAAHLDPAGMAVAWWDSAQNTWRPLPGQVDQGLQVVEAQADHPGRFELQGPLLCRGDSREPNDSPRDAHPLNLDGGAVRNLFDLPSDEDWFWFKAQAGYTYTVRFAGLAPGVVPLLEIYDFTGTQVQAALDAAAGGRLEWAAPSTGAYFVRLTAAPGSAAGCQADYEFEIQP